jgi:hypothetical protein
LRANSFVVSGPEVGSHDDPLPLILDSPIFPGTVDRFSRNADAVEAALELAGLTSQRAQGTRRDSVQCENPYRNNVSIVPCCIFRLIRLASQ